MEIVVAAVADHVDTTTAKSVSISNSTTTTSSSNISRRKRVETVALSRVRGGCCFKIVGTLLVTLLVVAQLTWIPPPKQALREMQQGERVGNSSSSSSATVASTTAATKSSAKLRSHSRAKPAFSHPIKRPSAAVGDAVPFSPRAVATAVTILYNDSEDFGRFMYHSWSSSPDGYDDPAMHVGVCRDVHDVLQRLQNEQATATAPATNYSFVLPSSNATVSVVVVAASSTTGSTPNATSRDGGNSTTTTTIVAITVHFDFPCRQLIRDGWGTGNIIELVYKLRLQCMAYNATAVFTCRDAHDERFVSVVPWILGATSMTTTTTSATTTRDSPTLVDIFASPPNRVCFPNRNVPIGILYRDMQFRLRCMAIALMGLPLDKPTHPSHAFAQKYWWSSNRTQPFVLSDGFFPPGVFLDATLANSSTRPPLASLFRHAPIDDVALHFRCGDLMEVQHEEYEFIQFRGYAKFISPQARSIGIVTTAFSKPNVDNDQSITHTVSTGTSDVRDKDSTPLVQDRCRVVVTAFVDYLQRRHPNARVTIHNGVNETILSSYVRLIMANQSIAGTASTFGVFPVIASFGTAYLNSAHAASSMMRTQWMIDAFGHGNRTIPGIVLTQDDSERAKLQDIHNKFILYGNNGVVAWFQT